MALIKKVYLCSDQVKYDFFYDKESYIILWTIAVTRNTEI